MIRNLKKLIVTVILAALAELVIFNYPWLEWKLGTHAPQRSLTEIMTVEGASLDPENNLSGQKGDILIRLPAEGTVDSLQMRFEMEDTDVLDAELLATDEGFSQEYSLGTLHIKTEDPRIGWQRIHAFGKIHTLTVRLIRPASAKIHIAELSANVPPEMDWNGVRFILMAGLGMVFCMLCDPSSWKTLYVERKLRHRLAALLVLLAEMGAVLALSWAGRPNIEKCENFWTHGSETQYQQLARSLLAGKLTISSEEKPDWDTFIDNPYDKQARMISSSAFEGDYFDLCYYKGEYYVYFGIVPVLLFYVPFRLLTGQDLNNYWPNLFCWLVILIAFFRLTGLIVRKRFPKTSFLTWLLLSASCLPALAFQEMADRFSVYEVPGSSGIMFALLGLCFWADAWDRERISCPKAALGSLCIALVAGCRPPQVLILLTGFVFFGSVLYRNGKVCAHRHIKEIVCLCAPVIAVAALLMAYNAVRFGSPFDFGEKYNLTVCDMSKKGFSLIEAVQGIFVQLLQPILLNLQFPFVSQIEFGSAYMGYQFVQNQTPFCGGLLALCPVLLTVFAALLTKDSKKGHAAEKRMMSLTVLLAFLLCAYESGSAGFATRYRVDSALMLLCALAFAVPYLEERFAGESYAALNRWHGALSALVPVSLALSFFAFFQFFFLEIYNPDFWYAMKYFFKPW